MLIDGMRYPLQNQNATKYDPTIIPALAIERVDVLADGASATYGSDASAGVLNVILKRGYDGAITQLHVGTQRGALNHQETQLFGRTWDGGDITVTFQHWETAAVKGSELPFYKTDFTSDGFDNETSIKTAIPGIVSTGAPVNGRQSLRLHRHRRIAIIRFPGARAGISAPQHRGRPLTSWATLLANAGSQ